MEIDTSLLLQVLTWVLSGGGAGVITYLLIEKALDKWPAFANLDGEYKRYVAFALSVLIAWGAFAITVAMDYLPSPGSTKEWVEQVFAIGLVAVTTSQTIHARVKLRN
jgi:hypothetical protein